MNYTQLHKKVIDSISSSQEAVAVIAIGKAALYDRTLLCELRDIDLMVIQKGKLSFERQVEVIEGLPYDISYIDINDLKEQLHKKNPIWIGALAKGKVEYIKDGYKHEVEELIGEAVELYGNSLGTPEEDRVKFIRFSVFSHMDELSCKLEIPLEFRFCSSFVLNQIIDYYFELNGIWQPKPKKKLEVIKSNDYELYNHIKTFYNILDSQEGFEQLAVIAKHVLLPFGGILETFEKGVYPLEE